MQIYANWICKNFLIFDACSLDMMIFNPKVTIQKFALLLVSYLKALRHSFAITKEGQRKVSLSLGGGVRLYNFLEPLWI